MKPYGREKMITAKWKRDAHLHPKHKVANWWEDICRLIPRCTMKHNWRKEMEREELINSPEYKEESAYIDAWRDGYKEAVAETCKWLKKEFKAWNRISVEAIIDKYYNEMIEEQQ